MKTTCSESILKSVPNPAASAESKFAAGFIILSNLPCNKNVSKLGFYVICETDIETYGFFRRLPNVPYRYDTETGEWPCTMPEL